MREVAEGVAVVGAGLAGFTLAAVLRAKSWPVEVVEARDSLGRTAEHTYCLWRGALMALDRVGLAEPIRARAAPIHRLRLWSGGGRLLLDLPARAAPVEGLAIRTGQLEAGLRELCSDVPLHFGQHLIGYSEDDRGVLLSFRSGLMRAPIAVG